ncbi:TIGR02300 family protein [Methyloceanibacter sp.]|uniref:TIGR02300 family protein n=1 Tax=Methyloceanibacter sp. TaxID=1965321 RepID=UPI003D6C7FE8
MSKPARGSKRVCQSCGARFYDLGRTPIVCPACQAVYQVTQPTSRRGERAPVPEVREKVVPKVEAVALEPETISLEEVEEAGEDAAIEDEEIVDLGEEAEIPAAGEDDTFLEEPEGDEEADVSGIVSGPEKEEG